MELLNVATMILLEHSFAGLVSAENNYIICGSITTGDAMRIEITIKTIPDNEKYYHILGPTKEEREYSRRFREGLAENSRKFHKRCERVTEERRKLLPWYKKLEFKIFG